MLHCAINLFLEVPQRTDRDRSFLMARGHIDKIGAGFGLIRFRSPLLTESRLISFPADTKMFQFSALARHGLCVHPCVTPSGCPATTGCPIRRSRDLRLFDTCPGLIAAYHVLLRFLTPRHPPWTLTSLTTSFLGFGQARPINFSPYAHTNTRVKYSESV